MLFWYGVSIMEVTTINTLRAMGQIYTTSSILSNDSFSFCVNDEVKRQLGVCLSGFPPVFVISCPSVRLFF